MSGTTSSTTSSSSTSSSSNVSGTTIVPLIEQAAGTYDISQLYQPSVSGSTGNIVPAVYSMVWQDNAPYKVDSVDLTNLTFVLVPAILSDETDGFGLSSIVSYGNDKFRAYYDTRAMPYRLTPDARILVYDGSPSTYQITRYPGTSNAVVISRYYDATGNYVGSLVPLTQTASTVRTWSCQPCQINVTLDDEEELLLTVFNEVGAEVATVSMFAKQSIIINDALTYRPKIASIGMTATQTLQNGNAYVFEKQSLDSLNIQAVLTYSDGTTRTVAIDNQTCFLYGAEDFVSAYAGMSQTFLLKYYLALDEEVVSNTVSNSSVSCEFNVVVVPNKLASPLKLSVIPEWNLTASEYQLRYYYYTTDGTAAIDVTSLVTISSGTFSGSNYASIQSFQVSLDMSKVDSVTYPTTTTYVQNVAIRLQPQAALVRWTIQDAASSPYVYGADSTTSRRPVMYYDSTRLQYFIPTSIFTNQQALLQSFYYNANPPYDPSTETTAPAPTHFLVRDAFSGAMIIPEIQEVSDYGIAFSLNNGSSGNYVGSTLVVEFLQQVSSSENLILYGVPVDVYTGTYQGP